MLNPMDRRSMQLDVEKVITSFGKKMTVYRSLEQNKGSFAGSHKTNETIIGEYPVEQKLLAPKTLTELGADLVIIVSGKTDIQEGDRVLIEDKSYIVSHIHPQNAFGAVTHLEVNLEKDDRYP